jgi:hypothetical protein
LARPWKKKLKKYLIGNVKSKTKGYPLGRGFGEGIINYEL